MGKKATKKFAKSGQLKKTIKARHQQKGVRRRIETKKAKAKGAAVAGATKEADGEDGEEGSEEEEVGKGKSKFAGMSMDDFLQGGFLDGVDDGDENDLEEDEDGDEGSDNEGSFASVDELEGEGQQHKMELSTLAAKDPEFYKYLQENDRELLDFDPEQESDEGEDSDDAVMMDGERVPVLTKEELNKWQKALLENSSLKALRKLLLAFRTAAYMNDEEPTKRRYKIDNTSVYNKLVTAALRYTPVVLMHHMPYKTLPNGKIKPPTQNARQKSLSKLVMSYFHAVLHLLGQSGDAELQTLALSESAKILPYVSTSRKAMKTYLKTCLNLWSSASDAVRISAFLALRQLASSFDASILDLLLKNSYMSLVRSCKHTTGFTIASINLMKNTAAELYCTDQSAAYQHAFRYIRQLAIHLRTSLKTKTKESHMQVYNWQYAHCVDFWSIVLSQACDIETEKTSGSESELKALVYPLVQVSLGAIRLVSSTRSFPFHLQIVRSLLRLTQHTRTYIPLSPYILPILQSILSPTSKHKPSTLRPLDLEINIRAPSQYLSTRIYSETLTEETVFLLAEWLGSRQVQCSIAFPEVIVPLTTVLRKNMKNSKGGKEVSLVKGLVEHAEEGASWIQEKRRGVKFGPGNREEILKWEDTIKPDETPMGKWLKVLRKHREKRKQLVEKSREGEAEILSE